MEREEAINLIKQVLPCLNIDEKIREGFVTLIPELKESEDEKVRKALIDGIRQIRCKNGVTQEQMLAWLEKQKEEEGYEAIPVESTLEYKLGFKAGKDSERQKDDNSKTSASEDERIRKELIEYLTHRTEVTGFIDEDKDCKRWIAYLEKQKEQKPIFKKGDKVIWDDEEFNILDVNETEYNVGGYRVPFSRQNELHPIWQKSAEWSEEDEEMLNSCISSIEEAKENRYAYKETDGDTSYDHKIAWLKSLRNRVGKEFLQPHWKPSEEQMEALKDAFRKDGCNEYRKVINSLYCDLQKLL